VDEARELIGEPKVGEGHCVERRGEYDPEDAHEPGARGILELG